MNRILVLSILTILSQSVLAATDYHLVYGSFTEESVAIAEADRQSGRFGTEFGVLRSTLADGEVTWRVTRGPYSGYGDAESARTALGAEAWILSVESQGPAVSAAQESVPVLTQVDERDVATSENTADRVRRSAPEDVNRGVRVVTADQFSRPQPRVVPRAEDIFQDDPVEETVNETVNEALLRQVQLRDIRVRGEDVLAGELAPIFSEYVNRPVRPSDLVELTNAANQIYLTQGYINSGLVLKNQQLRDGVLYLDEVLGRVDDVVVTSRLRPRYVTNRLTTETPFNLKSLQDSLALLEQDPRIENVNAHIRPGTSLGSATLDLAVNTPDFHRLGLLFDNNRSPSVGAEQTTVFFQSMNLTGLGDSLFASLSASEGLDSASVSYEVPIGSRGHSLTLGLSNSEGTVVEEPFDVVDIDSETESRRIGLNWMLMRRLDRSLVLELLYEQRRNLTSVLGIPFSFSDGAINGESRVAPVRVALQYVHQGNQASLSGRVVVSVGTSGYNATMNESRPDGEYTSVLTQFQYSRRISDRLVVTGKLLTQHAADPLLAIERVDLGGMDSVRGYRKNQLVRDNAILLSFEGRYRLASEPMLDALILMDIAEGSNHDDATSSVTDSLSSVGAGLSLRWRMLRADLMLAHGLDDVPAPQSPDLQDDGVHFRMSWEHSF